MKTQIPIQLLGRSNTFKFISDSSNTSFPPKFESDIIDTVLFCSSSFFKSGSSNMVLPNPEEINTADFLFFTNQVSFFVFNLIEFPITITSENAIAIAAIMGFRKPIAAIGIAITL